MLGPTWKLSGSALARPGAPARPHSSLDTDAEKSLLFVAAAWMCLLFCLACFCKKSLKVPWMSAAERSFRYSRFFSLPPSLYGYVSHFFASRSEKVIPHLHISFSVRLS